MPAPGFDKRRLRAFLILLSIIVLLIVARLVQLMIFAPFRESQAPISLPAVERGPILDRNGKILAISTRLDSVTAWIPNLVDPEGTADLLAESLNLSKDKILNNFLKNKGFVYIQRKITPTQSEEIKTLKSEGVLKGISLTPEFGRNYPERELASHVIGYVGVDNIGLDGIEYTLNNELSPPVVGQDLNEVFGNQVFLTIDINVQYIIEEIAKTALEENRADAVFILAMDSRNAEILGYSAVPRFDPNEFGRFPPKHLRNLPLTMAYEPGSVFKIISIASILQLKGITEQDEFFCSGVYVKQLPDGQQIEIGDLRSHGLVNAQKIIKYSCNVGAALASETVDRESFHRMLLNFGFDKPTGLLLPGESAGILADPVTWSGRTKVTLAFGQEISVSAVQMLAAATVFANEGLLLKPHIVRKIISPLGEVIKVYQREPLREVLSPHVARSILSMMQTATQEGGTARRGRIDGVDVSAKTGTAQVLDPETGTYSENHFIASYLAILPTSKPRLIVYVVIDYPRGKETYGSQIAAPVFKAVAERLIPYLGIPQEGDRLLKHSGEVRLTLPAAINIGARMPDLTGAAKRQLLILFQKEDLRILLKGDGYVVRQDPPPGSLIREGMTIVLELE